jgi:hypothetical protein
VTVAETLAAGPAASAQVERGCRKPDATRFPPRETTEGRMMQMRNGWGIPILQTVAGRDE